jgi:hypothetical protein
VGSSSKPADGEVELRVQLIAAMAHPTRPWLGARYFRQAQFSLTAGRHRPNLSQNRPARSSLVTDGKTLSMEAPR